MKGHHYDVELDSLGLGPKHWRDAVSWLEVYQLTYLGNQQNLDVEFNLKVDGKGH
jgi:hypothetical protein